MTITEIDELIQTNLATKAKLEIKLATLPMFKDDRPLKRKIAKCDSTIASLTERKLNLV